MQFFLVSPGWNLSECLRYRKGSSLMGSLHSVRCHRCHETYHGLAVHHCVKMRHAHPRRTLMRYLRRCHRARKFGGFPFDKARDARVMTLLIEIQT